MKREGTTNHGAVRAPAAGTLRREGLGRSRALVVLMYLVAGAVYLTWRPESFNPEAPVFSWIIYLTELYVFLTALLHIFMTRSLSVREPPPPPADLTVDAFVTTLNEPVEMVRSTLLTAKAMEYPHETWLLDDGNRPEMRRLAEELDCHYLARGDNTGAKAGNLNYGLAHSSAEFVAVFDADHAPQRHFLQRTLGYFRDEQVAFVQTPQDFYNLDSFQHRTRADRPRVWTEQSLFFRVIMRGKDVWNAAFFCGSCAVLRRQALDAIGGFPTETITEDLHASIRLHGAGYRSVYHAESLAFGVAPPGAGPFLRQRIRWGRGALQVWRREGILFRRGLTLPQRLNYLASVLTYFDGWQKAIFYTAPVIVLVTGVMPIAAIHTDFLIRFIPYYVLAYWAYEELGRGYGGVLHTEQYNFVRFAAFAWATVLGLLRGKGRFNVSLKGRVATDSEWGYLIPQLAVFSFNVAAVVVGTWLYFSVAHLPPGGFIATLVWAGIHIGVGGGVIAFVHTYARQRRRATYRFPVPLLARMEGASGWRTFGVVDDVSSRGFACYARFPQVPQIGENIVGEFYLPVGPLSLHAVVRSHHRGRGDNESYVKAIGCEFLQHSSEAQPIRERAPLELVLYGTDLQWRMNALQEGGETPIERIRALAGRHPSRRALGRRHWAIALCLDPDREQGVRGGLISVPHYPDEERLLLTFQPVPSGRLAVQFITRTGASVMVGEVIGERKVMEWPGPMYLYNFIEARAPIQQGAVQPAPNTAYPAPKAVSPAYASRHALRSRLAGIVTGVLLFFAVPSDLGAAGMVMGGGQAVFDGSYAYAGAVLPLGRREGLDGLVQRYWFDHLRYRYQEEDERISAEAFGAEAALGYLTSGAAGWFAAYGGVRFQSTRLSPDRPDVRVRGDQVRPKVQLDTARVFGGRWRIGGAGSYTFDLRSFWARGTLLWGFANGVYLGPEVVVLGDPEFEAYQYGITLEGLPLMAGVSLSLNAGVKDTRDDGSGAYGGFGVGYAW